MPSGAGDLGRPAAVGDVEEQRARGVGDVGGAVAGQAEADVVLREEHRADARPELGFVAPHPQQLGQGEAGEGRVERQLDEAGGADRGGDRVALGAGALIAPEQRGPDHLILRVEQRRTVHLAGKAHRRDGGAVDPGVGQGAADGLARRAPPVRRVLFGPARSRRGEGDVLRRRRPDDAAGGVDHERPGAARPDVDTQKVHGRDSTVSGTLHPQPPDGQAHESSRRRRSRCRVTLRRRRPSARPCHDRARRRARPGAHRKGRAAARGSPAARARAAPSRSA